MSGGGGEGGGAERRQVLLEEGGAPTAPVAGDAGTPATGHGHQRALSANSEGQPGLTRWGTAVGAPWEHQDYNREQLLQWLEGEQQQVKALFEGILKPDTDIPKSILPRPSASLTFKDVGFTLTKRSGERTTILEKCSGHFEPGQLIAIMGPSGCGKSTLLDMLANKKTAQYSGEILVNGHPRDALFQRVAAYVGQEDVMPQHWTVREAVEFNASLKRPTMSNIPTEFSKRALDVLLAAFGLTGVANTFIGGDKVRGCSGGQRRRVTLARGVSHLCPLLFADEPTSGLSATDAELCVKALRIISKKLSLLTLVVIHQPRVEVAQLFDGLVLLTSCPGRMVYSGRMADALAYWEGCGHPVPQFSNPTDVYLDLVTPGGPKDRSDEFAACFKHKQLPAIEQEVSQKMQERGPTVKEMLHTQHGVQSMAHMGPSRVRESPIAAPFTKQLGILFRRKTLLTRRNRAAIMVPIVVPIFLGLLLGVMYQGIGTKQLQQQISFVFMLLMRICMGGMQLMPQLIEDRTIMKYDTSEALYSVPAFIIVGIAVDISISLVGTLCSVLIMYLFSELAWKYFGMIIGWALLNFFVFDSFFAFLAATAPNVQIAQVAAIPFNSVFMLFSGFMITKESAPSFLRWIFELSPLSYAIQSIFCSMAKDHVKDGQGPMLIKLYGFEEGLEGQGVAVMVSMAIVFRVLQVINLQVRNNIQK